MEKDEFVIEVEHLTKRFGNFTAVDDITFDVRRGEIFGFLGANGAGKTTAMRMLTGLSFPTSGTGHVAGFDIRTQSELIKKHIGYMSQKFALYGDLTVNDNMELFAGIYGVPRNEVKTRIDMLLDRLSLSAEKNSPVKDLPQGWKQKIAFSVAIIHKPEIVFLDEPTGGMDIPSREIFRKLLLRHMKEGQTAVISTHHTADLSNLLSDIIILGNGRNIAFAGSAEEISARYSFGISRNGDGALYSEPCPEGYRVIMERTSGDTGEINLEMLFNAAIKGKLL